MIRQFTDKPNDEFEQMESTDHPALVAEIDALLDLDARGALVPHGIGAMARQILLKCRNAL